jgi:hypothetical protein
VWDPTTETISIIDSKISKIKGGAGGILNEYNNLPLSIPSSVSGSRFAPSYSPSTFVNIFSGSNYLTTDGIFYTEPNRGNIGLLPGVATKYNPPLTFVFEESESTNGVHITASLSSSLRGTIESLTWVSPLVGIFSASVATFSTIFPLEGETFEILVKSSGSEVGQFYNTSLYCLSIPTSSYIISRSGLTVNYSPYITSPTSNPLENYQVWDETIPTKLGDTTLTHTTEDEFYNGELKGTEYEVTNGELNDWNTSKYSPTLEISYKVYLYNSATSSLESFNNILTLPNAGEIYLWYDTGSTTNPGTGVPPKGFEPG